MNTIKKELRREMMRRRKEMPAEEVRAKSAAICRRVMETEAFQKAQTVCVYLPIRNEVDTAGLIEACRAAGKRTAAPRIREGGMEFYYFSSQEELKEGMYGIHEPSGSEKVREKALIVMPGVAFDRELHRIGHGGGYYDRYLTAHPEHETIAIAYDFQVLAQVPFEEHDIRPMDLITEKGEYQAG